MEMNFLISYQYISHLTCICSQNSSFSSITIDDLAKDILSTYMLKSITSLSQNTTAVILLLLLDYYQYVNMLFTHFQTEQKNVYIVPFLFSALILFLKRLIYTHYL